MHKVNVTTCVFFGVCHVQGKTNFFEKRVGEYAKANVMTTCEEDNTFRLDAAF